MDRDNQTTKTKSVPIQQDLKYSCSACIGDKWTSKQELVVLAEGRNPHSLASLMKLNTDLKCTEII
jgi:hypothetical protein